jgi:hypothetical protein
MGKKGRVRSESSRERYKEMMSQGCLSSAEEGIRMRMIFAVLRLCDRHRRSIGAQSVNRSKNLIQSKETNVTSRLKAPLLRPSILSALSLPFPSFPPSPPLV